jgi:hypothetical protein
MRIALIATGLFALIGIVWPMWHQSDGRVDGAAPQVRVLMANQGESIALQGDGSSVFRHAFARQQQSKKDLIPKDKAEQRE